MHVPDGFLTLPTSVATGAVAVTAVAVALRRSRDELLASGAPLAGLTAVFVFAAQMINFPVGAGTSGHLLGGTLAAALVGPWTAVLVMTVVLGVQGLFFADGGLTALGTNIVLMGLVPVLVGYGIARLLVRFAPARRSYVAAAAGVGALVSVPTTALVFAALFAAGGAVAIPEGTLIAAMVGWHVLIGLGEAVITTVVLSAILATRPDLVRLTRFAPSGTPGDALPQRATGPARRRWWIVAGAVPVVIAGGLSLLASSHPDGLEYVAHRLGFADSATSSAASGSVLADYGISGWSSPWATGVAGIIGLALVAVVSYLVLALVTRGADRRAASTGSQIHQGATADLAAADREPATR